MMIYQDVQNASKDISEAILHAIYVLQDVNHAYQTNSVPKQMMDIIYPLIMVKP